MQLKEDSAQFENIIDRLISGEIKTGLPPTKRAWIPKYVYHFTDLENAKSILTEGYVYSRAKANELGLMKVDNASSDVIDYTSEKWKSYARFYFRPKTPTQYNNEGIRCAHQISNLRAHCPVPIFFLFDSKSMLTMKASRFSYGNLAVNDTVYKDADSFENMPFTSVYHEGSYDTFYESHIKFNRHAELVIPELCSLEHLKKIVCRSAAEKETFLNMLDYRVRKKYRDLILVDTRNHFFNGKWTYIEEANLSKEEISFTLNKSKGNVTFKAFLKIIEDDTEKLYTWKKDVYEPKTTETFSLTNLKSPECYEVEFYLDEHLAYKGLYVDDDYLPF